MFLPDRIRQSVCFLTWPTYRGTRIKSATQTSPFALWITPFSDAKSHQVSPVASSVSRSTHTVENLFVGIIQRFLERLPPPHHLHGEGVAAHRHTSESAVHLLHPPSVKDEITKMVNGKLQGPDGMLEKMEQGVRMVRRPRRRRPVLLRTQK